MDVAIPYLQKYINIKIFNMIRSKNEVKTYIM